MLRRTLLTTTAALALVGAMAGPVFADPVTIRLVSKDLLTTNPEDVREIKAIEDALKAKGTDVDIQIVDMPSSGYADALSVKLLSGDIPDIIYFQGGDQKMAEQGILEDLNPWIAKSDYIKDALWPHNVDRLKNYPYLLYIYPPRAPQPVMRTDWLEKLGMEPPTTVEGYEELFQAIHDADLDGDGTKGNTLGLTGLRQHRRTRLHLQPGVRCDRHLDEERPRANGSIPAITDEEKAKIAFYAELADKGLFDKEYVTNTWDVKEDKFYSGKAGVIFGSSPEVDRHLSRQDAPGTSRPGHLTHPVAIARRAWRQGAGGRGRLQGIARLCRLIGLGRTRTRPSRCSISWLRTKARTSIAWGSRESSTPRTPTARDLHRQDQHLVCALLQRGQLEAAGAAV